MNGRGVCYGRWTRGDSPERARSRVVVERGSVLLLERSQLHAETTRDRMERARRNEG